MNIHRILLIVHGFLLLSACAPEYPPIAAGLAGDQAFKARIARNNGPGSPAGRLREELALEGFTIYARPYGRRYRAVLQAQNFPCFSLTQIDWTEDRRGRIVEIAAQRHECT